MNTKDFFDIKQKVIVILGATGILGSRYVDFLSSKGANIVISDLSFEKCESLALEVMKKYGVDPLPIKADITKEEDIINVFELTIKKYGKFDSLINNAQIKPEGFYAPFEKYSKDTLMKVLDGNLGAVIISCREACKYFLQFGSGSIINISSTYGNIGADQRIYDGVKNIYFPDERFSSPVSYGVTKAGILNLTRYLASYYREKNIRVNTLTPGGVFDNHDELFNQSYSSRTLLGRMAKADEYNAAILFLVSEASSYMTGANLIIDGGWTAI
ncbi:MAG: SDR family oxidoreductase [Ignavibacteriaceae bacterium]|nr:SDR family oxidoreductase [Ignavibacteriaceae bacterium]